MAVDRILLDLMFDADDAQQVAFTRYLCEQILETAPDHGPTLIFYADCLTELSLYDQAAAVLERATVAVPQKLQHLVFAQKGHRLEHMGQFAEAETEHLKAHELDPKDAAYLIYAGSMAFRRGDIQQAEAHARNAVLCGEGCFDEAYSNLGGYLLVQGRYAEARECYLRALDFTPKYRRAKKRLVDLDRLEAHVAEQNEAEQPLGPTDIST